MPTFLRQIIASSITMLGFAVLAGDAVAQPAVPTPGWIDRVSVPSTLVWTPPQPAPRKPSRDSLKNGVIIGAVAGAAAAGGFAVFFCNLYDGDSCVTDTLRLAAVGAAIGTGAGLAIDAALSRQGGVTVRVGVRF